MLMNIQKISLKQTNSWQLVSNETLTPKMALKKLNERISNEYPFKMSLLTLKNPENNMSREVIFLKDGCNNIKEKIQTTFIKGKKIFSEKTFYDRLSPKESKYDSEVLIITKEKFSKSKFLENCKTLFEYNKNSNNGSSLTEVKLNRLFNKKNDSIDTQTITEYTKNNKKYLSILSKRKNDGSLSCDSMSSNFIDSKDLTKLKNNPFSATKYYDSEDFARSVCKIAQKEQKVADKNIELFLTEDCIEQGLPNILGASGDNEVVIKLDNNISRNTLVEIINHEYRHHYQKKMINKLGYLNFKLNKNSKKLTPEENKLAREFCNGKRNYNIESYRNNPLEIDATSHAQKPKADFIEVSQILSKHFQNAKQILN